MLLADGSSRAMLASARSLVIYMYGFSISPFEFSRVRREANGRHDGPIMTLSVRDDVNDDADDDASVCNDQTGNASSLGYARVHASDAQLV